MNTKFVGLRFFTIYGPWGRPDMLIIKYLIASTKKIKFLLYNKGDHYRDFTYIEDVTKSILKLKCKKGMHEIYNVCSNKPINLKKLLNIIDNFIDLPKIIKRPMQKADVKKTHGSNLKILKKTNFKKYTNLKIGLGNTINWYKKYYKINI